MGISTQVVSQAAQSVVNQSLVRGVAVANTTLAAQQTIVNGTAELAKVALADNSTVTLTETRLSLNERPATVTVEPVRPGQLQLSPPQKGDAPQISDVFTPGVHGLPSGEQPTRLEPGAEIFVSGVQGDLVVPGGMARLEDVSVGAVRVDASPQAPVFTAPVLATSGTASGSQPSLQEAGSTYAQVVLVGSAQSIVQSAIPQDPPSGP